jgi:hypothetical protein
VHPSMLPEMHSFQTIHGEGAQRLRRVHLNHLSNYYANNN